MWRLGDRPIPTELNSRAHARNRKRVSGDAEGGGVKAQSFIEGFSQHAFQRAHTGIVHLKIINGHRHRSHFQVSSGKLINVFYDCLSKF